MRKNDIIERLIGMARIGATHKPVCDDDDNSEVLLTIPYLTKDVKRVLNDLAVFSSVLCS